jgi:O-acetyl-ADP-ribose deacetylase (regulator of RNase III)
VRVLLGIPDQCPADIVVLPGSHAKASQGSRIVTVAAPRWQRPSGPERSLAEAYRAAVAEANARSARTMVLPAILARGPWPLDDVTRVALTVLLSTPTTLQEVTIVARTPAMVERWAEALAREL